MGDSMRLPYFMFGFEVRTDGKGVSFQMTNRENHRREIKLKGLECTLQGVIGLCEEMDVHFVSLLTDEQRDNLKRLLCEGNG